MAALAGSLCASLAGMVANLTLRNKKYKKVYADMISNAVKGQEVKDRLCRLVDEDTHSFNRMMDAMRLPKDTEEEIAVRNEAIQNATKGATLVPFEVMERSLEAMDLAGDVAERGMASSASDAGVAALMARAAVEGAWLNVKINVPGIDDKEWVEDLLVRGAEIVKKAAQGVETVLAAVNRSIEES